MSFESMQERAATQPVLGDVITHSTGELQKLSVVADYVTIYALNHIKRVLKKADELQIILNDPVYNDPLNHEDIKVDPRLLLGDESESTYRNELQLRPLSREIAKLLEKKAKIRSISKPGVVRSHLLHVEGSQARFAVNLSTSDLNSASLGYVATDHLSLNTMVTEEEAIQQVAGFIDKIWNDPSLVDDAKIPVLELLKRGYQDYSPQYLYYFTLFNLFKDYLDELDEDKIVKSKTGIKDSLVWNKLYRFQRDGVLGAIDKIEKYNGCIIADSVGLGKTFEALAVIKYYELRNDRVLVLCPKKLRENWTVFTLNDRRNPLVGDRFNYDVLNHTDLDRDRGYSGEINLDTINWSNYDLVVIDESHNFRNNNPHRGHQTRYSKLMQNIIQSGVKTKVLMLSATPVNNRMNDLKNQVAFITEGDDTAFEEEGIESIQQVMKRAQVQFNGWLRDIAGNKAVDDLMERLDGRYFKLLDLLTIARSRKHIEKYYNIAEMGEFPERLPPRNVKSNIDLQDDFPPLKEINRNIQRLNLGAYSPLKYVRPDKQYEYSERYDMTLSSGNIFRQIDREESLIHLMRVNMLKRMESSIYSFSLTLQNLLSQIDELLDKIQNHSEYTDENLNIVDADLDDPELEDYLIGRKIKVLLQDMDLPRWKQELLEDRDLLLEMLTYSREVDAQRDAKLKDLLELIREKVANPINSDNNKVFIFTAFVDTANYLYEQIADWAKNELGIYTGLVEGSGRNKSNLKGGRNELNEILTNFSPRSKERRLAGGDEGKEIDILIATDCISEGQNLQDCDFMINYDIHWNPVRIIQRFGRIDRLGSQNTKIQLVNFWPNMELDEYIDLEERVSGRMVLLDISATGEENVIDPRKDMNDLDYRRQQLEQLQNEVIDLEEIHGGISITDLTYNDFKMDLMEFLKTRRRELEITPNGIHAITETDDPEIPSGVIFCLKSLKSQDVTPQSSNSLTPHYLIFMRDDGEVEYNFVQSKKILDQFQHACAGRYEPLAELVKAFDRQTDNNRNMTAYTNCLEQSVESIVGQTREKGTATLFRSGGTAASNELSSSVDDFEVVSWLVINNSSKS